MDDTVDGSVPVSLDLALENGSSSLGSGTGPETTSMENGSSSLGSSTGPETTSVPQGSDTDIDTGAAPPGFDSGIGNGFADLSDLDFDFTSADGENPWCDQCKLLKKVFMSLFCIKGNIFKSNNLYFKINSYRK